MEAYYKQVNKNLNTSDNQFRTLSSLTTAIDVITLDKRVNISKIVRFLDSMGDIRDGSTDDRILGRFRIVGEIVTMDQLYLTHLLTTGITIDQGINTWYTPVVSFDADFTDKMKEINQNQLSKLSYIRFKVVTTDGGVLDETKMSEDKMSTLIVFNLDTFNIFKHFKK